MQFRLLRTFCDDDVLFFEILLVNPLAAEEPSQLRCDRFLRVF
jgi:hypothetical protein